MKREIISCEGMMLVRVYWSMLEYIDKPGMAWLQVAQKD
jgi:hypothetical protein